MNPTRRTQFHWILSYVTSYDPFLNAISKGHNSIYTKEGGPPCTMLTPLLTVTTLINRPGVKVVTPPVHIARYGTSAVEKTPTVLCQTLMCEEEKWFKHERMWHDGVSTSTPPKIGGVDLCTC